MQNLTKVFALLASLLISACSSTSEKVITAAEKTHPRQGEEVHQVCNIDGWSLADGQRNALIVHDHRRRAFRVSLIGICDADWAMHKIAFTSKSGRDCLTRGDKIATDANVSRGATCTVMKIHRWLASPVPDNTLTKQEKSQGWQLLFNGQDMSQWRNFKKATLSDKWQVENGTMVLSEKGAGDIITKKDYQNFDLRLQWKISSAGNSGIFIMADELGKYIYSHAVEVQILDNERHYDNQIDSHLSGSLYDMVASPVESHKVAGEWNQVRILLDHKLLKVWQNNVLVTDIVIGSEPWLALLASSKFKDWQGFALNNIGHIGLQDHGDQVAFKNIKIIAL